MQCFLLDDEESSPLSGQNMAADDSGSRPLHYRETKL